MVTKFWRKWYKADELDRLKLVKTLSLPLAGIEDKALDRHASASLVNAYLEDLTTYLEKVFKKASP